MSRRNRAIDLAEVRARRKRQKIDEAVREGDTFNLMQHIADLLNRYDLEHGENAARNIQALEIVARELKAGRKIPV